MFRKAERRRKLLRCALVGPAGSGKTFSALELACGLGRPVAVIDTERGSSELYANRCEFDVLVLEPPYTIQKYLEAMNAAKQAGYQVLVIDQISHAWAGEGGLLDVHDVKTKADPKRNSYTAWRDVTPLHNKFIEAMLAYPGHLIATMRAKTAYEIVEDGGKKKPVKIGMAPVQREGMDYEFDVVFDLSVDGHYATASKDRTSLFDEQTFRPSRDTGEKLLAWLNSGVEAPEAEQTPGEDPLGVPPKNDPPPAKPKDTDAQAKARVQLGQWMLEDCDGDDARIIARLSEWCQRDVASVADLNIDELRHCWTQAGGKDRASGKAA